MYTITNTGHNLSRGRSWGPESITQRQRVPLSLSEYLLYYTIFLVVTTPPLEASPPVNRQFGFWFQLMPRRALTATAPLRVNPGSTGVGIVPQWQRRALVAKTSINDQM